MDLLEDAELFDDPEKPFHILVVRVS